MVFGRGFDSNGPFAGRVLLAVLSFAFLATAAKAEDKNASSSPSVTTSLGTTIPAKNKRIKTAWKLGLAGEGYADKQQQAQTAGLTLGGKLDYELMSALELKAEAGVDLESGYAQSRFGDNTPSSGVALKEAVVVLKPIQRFSISAGAIDQGSLNAPLLVSEQPFPGVKERALIGTRAFNAEIKAEQTIPTSKTLSTKAVEAEVTPSFTTETLALRTEAIPNVKLLAFGTHFAYRSLPSTVAIESERYGNTVTPLTANRSIFKYEFDGYVAGGEARVELARGFEWQAAGQILQNTKADASYGSGQMLSTALNIALAKDIDVQPTVGSFFAESDVAPGFYNSPAYGHNNRTGWFAKLDTNFKNSGFKAGVDFVDADLINPSTLQSHMSFFRIRFETLYDVL